ncbi:MAG: universal stress protein [Thermodesulfobacteriota bacterium]|nr:universal stress protein [Thermodesulfobacteriota bacterium]
MQKHLLVTVSEDKSALWGARFVGSFFSNKQDLKLTLFYIAPNVDEVSPQERGALDQAAEVLRDLGFGPDQVETKLVQRRFSKVMDIMREGHKGGYEAVILGRRGLCWLEDCLEKSVSNELFQEEEVSFPLWVCRKPDFNRKNVLVCVNGSEASCRVAAHAGGMLAAEEGHNVTLLHVARPGRGTPESVESILSMCEVVLREGGFPAERIETRVVEANDPAKAILSEAVRGRFAVVAVGRKGAGRGTMIKGPFMGSVSYALFKLLDGATLWVCR